MLGVRIRPVLEGILSDATTCWRVIVLEIGILKLLPYSWIPEDRWWFESSWLWFFCIFLFQCSCFCLSYSLTVIWITPNWLLLYSVTAAQPPYVESAILVSLFLFFSLEMTAFNDVETGSYSSEMLSMMSCRSSIISLLNLCCSLWPFCLKVWTWIFRFPPASSLSSFFLI